MESQYAKNAHSEVIHRLGSPLLRRRIQSDCRDDTGGGVDMPRVAQNMWVVQFCSHPKNSGRVPAAHERRDWGGRSEEHPNGGQLSTDQVHADKVALPAVMTPVSQVLSASLTVFPSVQRPRRETCPRMNRGFGFHSVDCSGLIIV